MHIRNLTQKLDIAYVVKDKWHLPVHKHTHYELQYIVRGRGLHVINDNSYQYGKGDIFIVPPQDNHFFIFHERTAICIIKFHESFFGSFLQDEDFRRLLSGFSSPRKQIMLSPACRKNIGQLMELIMNERKKGPAHRDIIIKNALALVLALLSEEREHVAAAPGDEKIQAIFNYIHRHITEKHLLSTEHIASEFSINKTYFNQYFTRATGCTYKKYVQQYALNLIAHRLLYQGRTLLQLAEEFGYSDESHLSKAFKAQFHQTPSAFRKARKNG